MLFALKFLSISPLKVLPLNFYCAKNLRILDMLNKACFYEKYLIKYLHFTI